MSPAAAPGTGQAACRAVDTDGHKCYLKATCGGTPGPCSGMCGYRDTSPAPPPPPPAPPVPPSPPGVTLRAAGQKHGVFMGAATNVAGLQKDKAYKQTEQEQYSLTTAENACKVGPIHPKPGPGGGITEQTQLTLERGRERRD